VEPLRRLAERGVEGEGADAGEHAKTRTHRRRPSHFAFATAAATERR